MTNNAAKRNRHASIAKLVRKRHKRYISSMENGKKSLKIAMAQLNPTVGAVTANADLLRAARAEAHAADIVVAGELF